MTNEMRLMPLDPAAGGAVFGEHVAELRAAGPTYRVIASGVSRPAFIDELVAFLRTHRFELRDRASCPTDRSSGYQETYFSTSARAVVFFQSARREPSQNESGYTYVSLVTASPELAESLHVLGGRGFDLEVFAREQREHICVVAGADANVRPLRIPDLPLVRTNYPPSALEAFDRLVEGFCSAAPSGRLAILSGPPGTGKTHFVRGLASALRGKANFIVISAETFEQIDGPTLVESFLDRRSRAGVDAPPSVLILEDADRCLLRRGSDNISSVQRLLNMSDGLVGIGLNLRIVATTNGKKLEVDEAIRRPGRLFAEVALPPLDADQSVLALLSILGGIPPIEQYEQWSRKPHTLAEIYEKARELGWTPPPAAVTPRRVLTDAFDHLHEDVQLETDGIEDAETPTSQSAVTNGTEQAFTPLFRLMEMAARLEDERAPLRELGNSGGYIR